MIESLIKEFEEMKQKRKERIELEQKILEEKKMIQNNNNDDNQKTRRKLKDSIQKYEPIIENDEYYR